MILMVRNALSKNSTLKLISFVISCSVWYGISNFCITTYSFKVPIYVYGEAIENIEVPEYTTITLRGYRCDFYKLNLDILTVHVNIDELHEGTNHVLIRSNLLFLPQGLTVIDGEDSLCIVKKQST